MPSSDDVQCVLVDEFGAYVSVTHRYLGEAEKAIRGGKLIDSVSQRCVVCSSDLGEKIAVGSAGFCLQSVNLRFRNRTYALLTVAVSMYLSRSAIRLMIVGVWYRS